MDNPRKNFPLCTGVLDYFPDALREVANVSRVGNEQHNPGEPLHWDKSKSTDEADALLRHLAQRGTLDDDGLRHTAKVAWRALALLQRELDGKGKPSKVTRRSLPAFGKDPLNRGRYKGYWFDDNTLVRERTPGRWIIDVYLQLGKVSWWSLAGGSDQNFTTPGEAWEYLMSLVEERERGK